MNKQIFYSSSTEETLAFGKSVGKSAIPGTIICLFGDLGAGKTTLIKGIVQALTGIDPEEICSPTFAYCNAYEGKYSVYHFDLYRLNGLEDFLGLGFEEFLFGDGVCCIEWSERITSIVPASAQKITLEYSTQNKRKILYEVSGC